MYMESSAAVPSEIQDKDQQKFGVRLQSRKMEYDIMRIPTTLGSFSPRIFNRGFQPSGHPACAWAAREDTPPLGPRSPETPAAFEGPWDLWHGARSCEIGVSE